MQIRKTAAVALVLLAVISCKRGEEKAAGFSKPGTPSEARGTSTTGTGNDVGAMMPEYAAMYLDGTKFDLAARRHNVVLLNVWATWCGPCVYEIPELQQIHDHYAQRGFEVVGVSVDESGVESVREFVAAQKKMTYPIALDADGKITNLLETSVLPTSVLVDRSGKIVWKRYGAIMPGDEGLKKAIEAAL